MFWILNIVETKERACCCGRKKREKSHQPVEQAAAAVVKNKQRVDENMTTMMKVSVNSRVKSNVKCIVGCLVLLSIVTIQTEAGSCRDSALCCNGRDSSCVVQKTPINTINEDPYEKPCYCDHACLKLGDCCGDFKSYCGGML